MSLRPEELARPQAMEQQTGATAGIVIWIERTYQRRGRRRSLGKLTPIEFETVLEVAHAA